MSTPPAPAQPAQHPSGSPRERIVQHALELFSARGYNGVSMSDIAQAAGVTKAALYYHFSDKEALFLEAYRTKTERLATAIDRMLDLSEPFEPLLTRIATTLLDDGLSDYRQLQTDLLTVVDQDRRAEFLSRTRSVASRLLPHFEAEQRAGRIAADLDLAIAVPLFFAMIGGQIRRNALGLEPSPLPHSNAEIASIIVRIWLSGIRDTATLASNGDTA